MLPFFGGAAKGAGKELSDQNDRSFQLKLLNRQIESHMASPEVSSALGDFAGVENQPGQQYNQTDVTAALGIGKTDASERNAKIRAGRRAERPQITTVGNQRVGVTWETDPTTGQRKPNMIPLGADPASYRKYADFAAQAESAYSRLDNIRDASKRLLTNKNLLGRLPKMASMTLDSLTGSGDEDVATFVDSLEANALAVAAVINQGRPSDPDRIAVQKAMPGRRDSLDFALRKLDNLEEIMSRTEKRSYEMLIDGQMEKPRLMKQEEAKGGKAFSADAFNAWKAEKKSKEEANKRR